jgi:hypothetical protein
MKIADVEGMKHWIRRIALTAVVSASLPCHAANCPKLVDAVGRSIFHPIKENLSILTTSSKDRSLQRIARINFEKNWYEQYHIHLRSELLPEHEYFVELVRLPAVPRYGDDVPADSATQFADYYVNPNSSGLGNYQISLIESEPPTSVGYQWRDENDLRYVTIDHDSYLEKLLFQRHVGLLSMSPVMKSGKEDEEKTIVSYSTNDPTVTKLAEQQLPDGLEVDPLVAKGITFFQKRVQSALGLSELTRKQEITLWVIWKRQIQTPKQAKQDKEIETALTLGALLLGDKRSDPLRENFSDDQILTLKKQRLIPHDR